MAAMKQETDALASAQAAEHQNFVEMVTKAAALQEVNDLPKDLLKYRFRPSKQLIDLRENVTRLSALGRKTLSEEFAAQSEELAKKEVTVVGSAVAARGQLQSGRRGCLECHSE